LEWKHPAKLHFIPIDFTKENLVTAITRSSSYDPKVKSLFSWLGVTPYLTQDEVFTTLRSIVEVALVNSIVVFDYLDTDIFVPEKVSPQLQKFMDFVQNIGEPIITGFNPQKLAEDLINLGFQLHENMSQADVEGRYLQERTDGYYMQEQAHLACAVIQ
jgi:O-methyltransferase involved in polyketide biosynthesis